MGRVRPPYLGWQHRIVCASAALLLFSLELGTAALPVLARVPVREAETIAETRLRSDPSLRSQPLIRIPAGATLTIRGQAENGWFRARHGRLEGYVRSGDIATAPLAAKKVHPGETPPSSGDSSPHGGKVDEPSVAERAQHARGHKHETNDKTKKKNNDARKEERKSKRKQERRQERRQHGASSPRLKDDVITSTTLNLRASPAQDAPVRVTVPRGERVSPTGEHQDGWVELRWEGDSGWALGRYLAAPRPILLKSDGDASTWSREELKAIIYDAADRYGQPREDMLRVARCESNLVPSAINGHGGSYGLFQFKPGTWLSTPYAEYDIFDPRASANAAAWMWSVGRRREWVCQ
jgi:uncharacterized protein YraI